MSCGGRARAAAGLCGVWEPGAGEFHSSPLRYPTLELSMVVLSLSCALLWAACPRIRHDNCCVCIKVFAECGVPEILGRAFVGVHGT